MAAKPFAVGDVLPATTQLRISWVSDILIIPNNYGRIRVDNDNTSIISRNSAGDIYMSNGVLIYDNYPNGFISPYTNYDGNHAYHDVDTSTWDINKRTVSSIHSALMGLFTWEDVAPQVFNITFEENGGTNQTDLTEQTVLPTPLPTPTRSGYTFVNWYYDSAFTQIANAGDTIESNVTLYAKWHNLGSLFTEIADAIRSKDGTSENIRDVDFGERVKQIQGAIELTQAQYDALETKDANTYYLIVEVE